MVRLMNSAMMPQEGIYRMNRISKQEFCDILTTAWEEKKLISYVGYQDNINIIQKWTGITVPFSRESTTLDDGDVLLIMKLAKRMGDPAMKGKTQFKENDFEFFIAVYQIC